MTSAAARHRPVRLAPVAVAWAAAVALVALVGGLATDTSSSWYEALDRPSWQPPGAVFGPVWTVLYVMIAISATLAWRDTRSRLVLGLFAVNLVLNVGWTWIFFQGHAPVAAGIEILAL